MTRRIRSIWCAVALLGAAALASGTLALALGEDERPDASEPAPHARAESPLRVLARSAAAEPLPSFAADLGVYLDRDDALRLAVSPEDARYGLWATTSLPVQGPDAVVPPGHAELLCLRLVPLTGPLRGEGGLSCAPGEQFLHEQMMLTVLKENPTGSVEIQPLTPRMTHLVSGVVPRGVRSVRVTTREGSVITRRTPKRAFLVVTDQELTTLRYTLRGRPVAVQLSASAGANR